MDLDIAVKIITPAWQDQKATRRCEKYKMVGPKRLRKIGSRRKMSKDRTVLMKGTSIEKSSTGWFCYFRFLRKLWPGRLCVFNMATTVLILHALKSNVQPRPESFFALEKHHWGATSLSKDKKIPRLVTQPWACPSLQQRSLKIEHLMHEGVPIMKAPCASPGGVINLVPCWMCAPGWTQGHEAAMKNNLHFVLLSFTLESLQDLSDTMQLIIHRKMNSYRHETHIQIQKCKKEQETFQHNIGP